MSEITDLSDNSIDTYSYRRDFDDKSRIGSANLYHKHSFSASELELLLQFHLSSNRNQVDQLEQGPEDIIYTYDFRNQRLGGSFTPSYRFSLRDFNWKVGMNTNYQQNKIDRREDNRSQFTHKEWTEYAYIDVNHNWRHFSLAASAGMEVVFRSVEGRHDRYYSFRPVVNLNYRFNARHSLTLNYNMQSTAPDVVQLNPYNTSSDTLSVTTGNPYLKPYRTQRTRLSYTLAARGFYLEPSVTYRQIGDQIVSTGEETSEGYIQSLANNGKSKLWTAGAALRYTIRGVGFVGIRGHWNRISFPVSGERDSYWEGLINWGLNFQRWGLSGYYGLPRYSYAMYKQGKSRSESWCTLTYSASDRVDLSVAMRYIGLNSKIQNWTEMSGYSYYYENRFTNRGNIVMIGIRYKIQNKKPERSVKKLEQIDKGFRLIRE